MLRRNTLIFTSLTLLTWLSCAPLFAQQMVYQIVDSRIAEGTIVAERICQGDLCTYKIKSSVTISMLFSVEVEYDYVNIVRNGELEAANFRFTRNGSVKEESKVWRENGQYYRLSEGKTELICDTAITYSVGMLYHHQPIGHPQVFSARHGRNLSLHRRDGNADEMALTLSTGRQTYYDYHEGIITRVTVNHPITTLVLELRP